MLSARASLASGVDSADVWADPAAASLDCGREGGEEGGEEAGLNGDLGRQVGAPPAAPAPGESSDADDSAAVWCKLWE